MPSLHEAQTGLGLDWCWPHLLGYPRDRIAVIDAACARHAVAAPRLEPRKGDLQRQDGVAALPAEQPVDCSRAVHDARCKGSLYAAALRAGVRQPGQEQAAAWAACGYSAAAAEAAGHRPQRAEAFGGVAADSRRPQAAGLAARLAACRQGLPRGLAEVRAGYLAAALQARVTAGEGAGRSWGHTPLLLAVVVLAPAAAAGAHWLWRLGCGGGAHQQRRGKLPL